MIDYFSVPSDFKYETIDKLANLNKRYNKKKVLETYGQITVGSMLSSGRYISELPAVDFEKLQEYIVYSKSREIGFNYTLNGTFMNNREFTEQGIRDILVFINKLYNIGVRSLTVTLPTLFEIIKASGLDFEIKASVICQINSVNKAMDYKERAYDRIVVDESVYRKFDILEDISKNFGEGVEIIVNSLCNQNCVNRMFHYNQTSGDVFGCSGINYYAPRCARNLLKDYEKVMQLAWIRPEDIHLYRQIGIHHFKLQGREYAINGDLTRAVESYFNETYEGNLMDLLDLFSDNFKFKFNVENRNLDGFINKFYYDRQFCKNNCHYCTYCSNYTNINMRKDIEMDIKELVCDEKFNKIDSYQNLIANVIGNKKDIDELFIEYDFD